MSRFFFCLDQGRTRIPSDLKNFYLSPTLRKNIPAIQDVSFFDMYRLNREEDFKSPNKHSTISLPLCYPTLPYLLNFDMTVLFKCLLCVDLR